MNNKEIILLNIEKAEFKKEDGTSTFMTKILFATQFNPDTDRKIGYDVFVCYVNDKAFDICKDYIGVVLGSDLVLKPQDGKLKVSISAVEGISF